MSKKEQDEVVPRYEVDIFEIYGDGSGFFPDLSKLRYLQSELARYPKLIQFLRMSATASFVPFISWCLYRGLMVGKPFWIIILGIFIAGMSFIHRTLQSATRDSESSVVKLGLQMDPLMRAYNKRAEQHNLRVESHRRGLLPNYDVVAGFERLNALYTTIVESIGLLVHLRKVELNDQSLGDNDLALQIEEMDARFKQLLGAFEAEQSAQVELDVCTDVLDEEIRAVTRQLEVPSGTLPSDSAHALARTRNTP